MVGGAVNWWRYCRFLRRFGLLSAFLDNEQAVNLLPFDPYCSSFTNWFVPFLSDKEHWSVSLGELLRMTPWPDWLAIGTGNTLGGTAFITLCLPKVLYSIRSTSRSIPRLFLLRFWSTSMNIATAKTWRWPMWSAFRYGTSLVRDVRHSPAYLLFVSICCIVFLVTSPSCVGESEFLRRWQRWNQ